MRIDPTYPAAYINRGNVWFHRGDFDRAIADYNQAIQRPATFDGVGNASSGPDRAAPY